jgi:hypothetical protein
MFISIHWAFASILDLGFAGLRRIVLGSAAASGSCLSIPPVRLYARKDAVCNATQ